MSATSHSSSNTFTLSQLRAHDGEDGLMYIAYRGRVYDVSECFHWRTGIHEFLHFPGQDLTGEFIDAPHGEEVFDFPCVKLIGYLTDNPGQVEESRNTRD